MTNPVATQFQRYANDITARLAQLAKDPPDLLSYFRVHAESIAAALRPAGFAYEMQNGQGFQRLLHSNLESLNYPGVPEQENAFQRALVLAGSKRQPVRIPPHTVPSGGLQGLSVEDAPAPEELPIFNRTAFEQIFVPILLGQTTVGVLHIWFHETNAPLSQARVALLQRLCGEVELYLKARRLSDISQEVTRLTTYSRLLENLSGDLELESVTWNIVNFARETLACDRVCLFVARNYEKAMSESPGQPAQPLEYEFDLFACSGLKKPNPRSEQAVILRHVAQKLTQMSLSVPDLPPRAAPVQPNGLGSPSPVAAPADPSSAPAGGEGAPPAQLPDPAAPPNRTLATNGRPRARAKLALVTRESLKTASRSQEVQDYFEIMPMNWATVLPLFDRDGRVCGIVLFEGIKPAEKLPVSFAQMHDLGISAGRALGTALFWNRHISLRLAHRWIGLRHSYVNTPPKRKFVRFGLPVLTLLAVLLLPVDYRLKGDATVLPTKQVTLPCLVPARLETVEVREGQSVKQGEVLARLDTRDLELQLRQVEQEYERSLLESQSAMSVRDETRMQVARLNAAKAQAVIEKFRREIDHATLRAPFDGIVLGAQTISTRVGEVMRPGEPILEVVDPSSWKVKVSLREQDLIYLGEAMVAKQRIPASLTLAANPTRSYDLVVDSPNQIAYGLDTVRAKYEFTVMVPLETTLDEAGLLKSGFAGRAKFSTGRRPLAYVFFRDFVNFLRVRFF